MRGQGISGNRMWGWLALVVVAAVALVIGLPMLMSVVKVSHENPAAADQQTTQRTEAKGQNPSAP